MAPSELMSVRLQMVIAPSLVAAVDAWRKQQDDIPSRSEAIRLLVTKALSANGIDAEARSIPKCEAPDG